MNAKLVIQTRGQELSGIIVGAQLGLPSLQCTFHENSGVLFFFVLSFAAFSMPPSTVPGT